MKVPALLRVTSHFFRSMTMATPKLLTSNNTLQKDVEEKSKLWCEQLSFCMPRLDSHLHKGDSGRIGVIGGCDEYTGAPHYAGMTALRCGADLLHIFSTPSAGQVLKSYGPEAIVHGILKGGDISSEIKDWLPRLHAIVLGPGLGRDPKVIESASSIIRCARDMSLPLVVDADGLWMVLQEPELITSWPKGRIVLTPNIVEFSRLAVKNGVSTVDALAEKFGATVLLKRGIDYAASPQGEVRVCGSSGSGRRCGGQGDVLSGALGVFLSWTCKAKDRHENTLQEDPTLVAAYAACRLTRECNKKAFAQHGRSTLTMDMIGKIHDAFEELFEEKNAHSS